MIAVKGKVKGQGIGLCLVNGQGYLIRLTAHYIPQMILKCNLGK